MNKVFNLYARYYDLLYQDKDYATEAAYVASHIRKQIPNAKYILDLGCGTGAHAEHLARMGFIVHGIDLSETMLASAAERKRSLPADISAKLSFSLGDIRTIRVDVIYDVVVSLFHVMSYQTSNVDIKSAFATAAAHLGSGGLFLFDFWYGSAVLAQKPRVRVKRLEDDEIKITRIAEPIMRVNEDIVDVNYTVFVEIKADGRMDKIHEKHTMRYLFLPEIDAYGGENFSSLASCAWMTTYVLSTKSWSGLQLSIRR